MLRLGSEREEPRIVDEQWGAPTFAVNLADAILVMAQAIIRDSEHAGPETSVTTIAMGS
jgi:dTDP-4-dehydrorhamnose reductase